MTRAARATPRPWFLHDFTEALPEFCTPSVGDVTVSCDHPATITIASMGGALTATIDEARANAALIVRAVNAYDDLIALARMVVEFDGPGGTDSPMAEAAQSALAKAGEP